MWRWQKQDPNSDLRNINRFHSSKRLGRLKKKKKILYYVACKGFTRKGHRKNRGKKGWKTLAASVERKKAPGF